MIAKTDHATRRPILRLGDEPEDLALGRLLISQPATGDQPISQPALGRRLISRESQGERPPLIRFPRKDVVPSATDLSGESAEWLLRRVPVRIEERWLLELAGLDRSFPDSHAAPLSTAPLRAAALRDIRVLVASARRSAAHDLRYAFNALAGSPEDVRHDPRLRAFREEVNRAVGAALKTRPVFGWRTALVVYYSAEAVEDIVSARWRDRLTGRVVLAANPGYEGGLVSYAFRAAPGTDAAGIIKSALPPRSPPPRVSPDGTAGRGMLTKDRFEDLLSSLRFKRGLMK